MSIGTFSRGTDEYRYSTRSERVQETLLEALKDWCGSNEIYISTEVAKREVAKLEELLRRRRRGRE